MSYFDRLQTGSMISPEGDQYDFSFENLTRDITHRIGTFEFSGVDGTLHQNKGVSGEIYPLQIYFHGQDYDLISDSFFRATKQTGPWELLHPRWGKKRVQLLSVSQRENLKSEGGQATFEVTFQETLEREFPKTGIAPKQKISGLQTDYRDNAINSFGSNVKTENLSDRKALEQSMSDSGYLIKDKFSDVAQSDQDIFSEFLGYANDIINNASSYVDDPLSYASRVVDSILLIANIPGRISSKLLGYSGMIDSIIGRAYSLPIIKNRNDIIIRELLGNSSIVSASRSINDNISNSSSLVRNSKGKATATIPAEGYGYSSRADILNSVIYLKDTHDSLINYLDESYRIFNQNLMSENYYQSAESYISSWDIASITIKAGLDVSFSLPVKVSFFTNRARTILDLCYELYQNIDDDILEYFIKTNGLTGEEIIMVPQGTEIIYYA